MSKPYNVVTDLFDLYWDDPVAFAEDMMGFDPDDWQCDVMMDVTQFPRTSVRSGQGVGKTGLEAALVIWFLCCRPNPKVVCTAPTKQQLHDVLWAEVSKWLENSMVKNLLKWTKTKVYMIGHEQRWFATARTAYKPENMQGFHEDYMLFIVDEASGVSDPIMEAILGTLSGAENKLLMCGNPTRTSGFFFMIRTTGTVVVSVLIKWILVAAVLLIVSAVGNVFGFEISEELSTNITGLAMAILGLR
ncbi:Terminase B [Paenibacillus glucanolyticus]|jgi:phage terminase large subunit|nr:hypothetical protein C169_13484 [Paenibacillus sp. FSL R5-808]